MQSHKSRHACDTYCSRVVHAVVVINIKFVHAESPMVRHPFGQIAPSVSGSCTQDHLRIKEKKQDAAVQFRGSQKKLGWVFYIKRSAAPTAAFAVTPTAAAAAVTPDATAVVAIPEANRRGLSTVFSAARLKAAAATTTIPHTSDRLPPPHNDAPGWICPQGLSPFSP